VIIAVTGATGIVGRFVCEHFLTKHHTVRGLHRSHSNLDGFGHAPEWIVGDMQDEEALSTLLAGADAVVHCAFSHVPGRYRGGEGSDLESFWQVNLGGTRRLLEIARDCEVERVVLLSSRAVFGRRRAGEDVESPIADEHPLWPDSQYGALKAAEEAIAGATRSPIVCALRPTGVYGIGFPVEQSKWYDLVQRVMQGESIDEVRAGTEVHGSDVAAGVECLLAAPAQAVQGHGFNCSDLVVSTRDLVRAVADCEGLQADLPAASLPVRNPMDCRGLRELGWSPGGESLYLQTVRELITAVRALG